LGGAYGEDYTARAVRDVSHERLLLHESVRLGVDGEGSIVDAEAVNLGVEPVGLHAPHTAVVL